MTPSPPHQRQMQVQQPQQMQSAPSSSRTSSALVSPLPRNRDHDRAQRQASVDTWQATCAAETRDLAAEAERFEYAFLKALHSSAHLGSPNALRTAIALHVVSRVGSAFARFEPLLTSIRRELERATYARPPVAAAAVSATAAALDAVASLQAAASAGLSRPAFFAELQQARAEQDAVQMEVRQLDERRVFMAARLRGHEQAVDRLARRWAALALRQALADWKKVVARRKYTRVLLVRTSARWRRERLRRLVRAWAAWAAAERARGAAQRGQQHGERRAELQQLLARLRAQTDGARAEARAHREHADHSRRHALSLEELLARLERRVRASRERRLQEASNQWAALCLALADAQLAHLERMLAAAAPREAVDAARLLARGEELADLLALPADALVLRWVNFQLAHCEALAGRAAAAAAPPGLVQNFSSDMRRNYVLRRVLRRVLALHGRQTGSGGQGGGQGDGQGGDASRPSPERRASSSSSSSSSSASPPPESPPPPLATDEELHAALTQRLEPACPPLLCAAALGPTDSDLTFCLFAFLLCEHPSLEAAAARPGAAKAATAAAAAAAASPVAAPWQEARAALEDARRVWAAVRQQWTELRRPFQVADAGHAAATDADADRGAGHDADVRVDATAPPQLLARANLALQNAVHSAQYAAARRGVALRAWEALRRRVQAAALRLLVRRARQHGPRRPPAELVDRRAWREKFMLTTLHADRLARMFARMDAAGDGPSHGPSHGLSHGPSHGLDHGPGDGPGDGPGEAAPALGPSAAVEAELREVEAVLLEHYDALRQVYRHYASIDADDGDGSTGSTSTGSSSTSIAGDEARFFRKISASMSLREFHAFLKDCRMFGSARAFPYAFIQRVFEHVNGAVAATAEAATATATAIAPAADDAGIPSDSDDGDPSEMTPAEFVEALVLIVRSPLVGLRVFRGASASAVAGLSLAQRMRRCVEEIILPNAMRDGDQSRAGLFRPLLLTPDCRAVLTAHLQRLRAVYTHFAAREPPRAAGSRMLSVDGLAACCRHFDLFRDNLLNLDDLQHVLAHVLQLDRESIRFAAAADGPGASGDLALPAPTPAPAPDAHARDYAPASDWPTGAAATAEPPLITFAEFLEALAALACYLHPDAFVPLATKLDLFFAGLRL